MLQSLICLLVLGVQARVDSICFLTAGYRCLSDLDLESTVEQGKDNTIQKQDGVQDIAELRLSQGSCLFHQKEQEQDHGWDHPGHAGGCGAGSW